MTWLWWLSSLFSIYLRRVTGKKQNLGYPCIIAVNHEGPLDGLFLLCALQRPLFFLATHTLINDRSSNLWWWHKFWVFILGQAIATGPGTIDRCVKTLKQNKTLCIFPEGRIHPSSPDRRIHGGVAVIAHKAQVPIFPIRIVGSGTIWPITNTPINLFRFNSVEVRIGERILPPKPEEKLSTDDYRKISANVFKAIQAL